MFSHVPPFFVVYPLEGLRFLYIFGDPGLLCGAPHYYLPPQIFRLCLMPVM